MNNKTVNFVTGIIIALCFAAILAMAGLHTERRSSYKIGIYPNAKIISIYPNLSCDDEQDNEDYTICLRRGGDGKKAFEKLEKIMRLRD